MIGLLSLWLPETKGEILPEFIHQVKPLQRYVTMVRVEACGGVFWDVQSGLTLCCISRMCLWQQGRGSSHRKKGTTSVEI